MSEIRIADLFAGIGGIRMGMVQALGDAAHVVYSSEWNKYSVQTYEANWHDENPVAGDITKVDEHDVPDIDLLLAGFPCQPFSIAGVSKKQSMGRPTGFEDKTQGTLFFDVARIIKAKQPKAFLLENVKNLLSHDRGRTFKTIYSVLTEDLGYHVTYKLIDAAGFVPQHGQLIGDHAVCPAQVEIAAVPQQVLGVRAHAAVHECDLFIRHHQAVGRGFLFAFFCNFGGGQAPAGAGVNDIAV